MTKRNLRLVGLAREQLIRKFRDRRVTSNEPANAEIRRASAASLNIPDKFYPFDKHLDYEKILLRQGRKGRLGVENHFFKSHDGLVGATSQIGGKSYINFPSYNYSGLSGDTHASRLVAGERLVWRELNRAPGLTCGVGLPPVMGAVALGALDILDRDSVRVVRLRQVCGCFLEVARAAGVDTGYSQGYCVTPAIVGSSQKSVWRSIAPFAKGAISNRSFSRHLRKVRPACIFSISCKYAQQQTNTAIALLTD